MKDAVYKVVLNGKTIIDISDTSLTPRDVPQGKYFYLGNGIKIEGSSKETILGHKLITENGEYYASFEGIDGFSSISVEVPTPTIDKLTNIITQNGSYLASDFGIDGISSFVVNVAGQVDIEIYDNSYTIIARGD